KLKIDRQDWRELSVGEQQTQLTSVLEADRRQGFKLSKAPLMRFRLIQTSEVGYTFVWSYHHILLDGWSLGLILDELFRLYSSFGQGQPPALEPSRPYQHYISWLQNQKLSDAEAFWRRLLAGFTAPTTLGGARSPEASGAPESYGDQHCALSESATHALQ